MADLDVMLVVTAVNLVATTLVLPINSALPTTMVLLATSASQLAAVVVRILGVLAAVLVVALLGRFPLCRPFLLMSLSFLASTRIWHHRMGLEICLLSSFTSDSGHWHF